MNTMTTGRKLEWKYFELKQTAQMAVELLVAQNAGAKAAGHNCWQMPATNNELDELNKKYPDMSKLIFWTKQWVVEAIDCVLRGIETPKLPVILFREV